MTEIPSGGLRRRDLEYLLQANGDIIHHEPLGSSGASWLVDLQFQEAVPVRAIVENALNPIYVNVLIPISPDQLVAAVEVTGPYASVGVATVGGQSYLRSAFFIDHSNMHALSNAMRGAALAYAALLRA